ncbi:hypothetical protein pb186bvf_020195 [Paramecium bursaria]
MQIKQQGILLFFKTSVLSSIIQRIFLFQNSLQLSYNVYLDSFQMSQQWFLLRQLLKGFYQILVFKCKFLRQINVIVNMQKEELQKIRPVQKQIQRQRNVEIIEIKKNIKKLIHKKRRNSNYITQYLEPLFSQIKKNLNQRQIAFQQIKQQNGNEVIQEFQTNLNQINKQLQQLDIDQVNMKQQMIKDYQRQRQTQELSEYKHLMQSKLEDLKKVMVKEDFEQPKYGQQENIPKTAQYIRVESIEQMEQIITNDRNKINLYIIRIHLFIDNTINKEKNNEQIMKQLEQHYQKSQFLLKDSSTKCDENLKEFSKLQKALTELELKSQGTILLQSNLQTYSFLKNIYQESKNSCFRLDSLKNELQELNQKVLGINKQLTDVFCYSLAEINQNIHQKDNDFQNEANYMKNKFSEFEQALKDRNNLIKKLDEAQFQYEQQQAQNSRYGGQIIQLQNVLEKQIPQVLKWSEKEFVNEFARINEKLVYYEQEIQKNYQQLNDIKKCGGLSKQQREDIKKSINDIQESLSNVKKAKTTIGFQLTEICIKLNQLKLKNIENSEVLLQDLNQIIIQIETFKSEGEEIEIQREFDKFVQQLNENGSKRPNNALFQSYLVKQKEHTTVMENKRGLLQEKKNELEQKLSSGSIPQRAFKQQEIEQTQQLKEEIIRYKQHKQKLKKRSAKVMKIRQQQIEEMTKLQKLYDNVYEDEFLLPFIYK